MIKNLWNKISIFCIHGHEEPIPMKIQQGPSSPFYACPKYFEQNREPGERPCGNRLNFIDAENLVAEFSRRVEEDIANGGMTDYTNMEFDYKLIHVKVLKYSEKEIKLGILNRKAFK